MDVAHVDLAKPAVEDDTDRLHHAVIGDDGTLVIASPQSSGQPKGEKDHAK